MAMIICPECGQEISDKAKKCVHCGKILIEEKPATKVCSDCGKENPIDMYMKINSNRWNIHGKHYEDPLSTKFQIVKIDFPTHEVSEIAPYEQAYLKRIFEDVNTYKPLRFLCDGYEDIYYMCTLQINWYQVGGVVIGAEITVTCDSEVRLITDTMLLSGSGYSFGLL